MSAIGDAMLIAAVTLLAFRTKYLPDWISYPGAIAAAVNLMGALGVATGLIVRLGHRLPRVLAVARLDRLGDLGSLPGAGGTGRGLTDTHIVSGGREGSSRSMIRR